MSLNWMILLVPFVLFLSIYFEVNLTQPFILTAYRLQSECIDWFSNPKAPNDLSGSFICGKKVTNTQHKSLLQKSGLYHAIVVSGGHFLFLEYLLKRLALPTVIRFLILLLYYLTTGLQPPGLRCLAQMGLAAITVRLNLKMSSSSQCFLSGLLCLALCSLLWNSLSFWLSFAVSMSLCFSHNFLTLKDSYRIHVFLPLFFIYLFLIPFNYTAGYLHPLNLILGFLLLYPFCCILLASAIFMLLAQLFNFVLFYSLMTSINDVMFQILQKWTLLIPNKNTGAVYIFSFWIYLLFLIGLLHITTVYFRRETIHE